MKIIRNILAVILALFVVLGLSTAPADAGGNYGEACFSVGYNYSGQWLCIYAPQLGQTYVYNDFRNAGINDATSSLMVGGWSFGVGSSYSCQLSVYRDINRQGPYLFLDYKSDNTQIQAPDGHTLYFDRARADLRNAYLSNGANADQKISSAEITCTQIA